VTELRIAEHPRARNGVRRARGFGGLVGFALGAWLAHGAALPLTDVLLRGLLAGVGAHCAAWLLAVTYWRAAILAELETVRRRREVALAEAADRVMREAAAAGQQTV
jgi:hypothetical protein